LLSTLGVAFALSAVASYALTLVLPFDSFRIAHDLRQAGVLGLHYLALAVPFFCSGLAVAGLFAADPAGIPRTYAANLGGSAAGCLLAVAAPAWVGGEGVVLLAGALALAAAVIAGLGECRGAHALRRGWTTDRLAVLRLSAALFGAALLGALAWRVPAGLALRLSPYKSLSYALLYPDSRLLSQRWNGFSRVDVVASSAIRSLPGSSVRCTNPLPPQIGLTVDGDDLSPISLVGPRVERLAFTDCVLTALPYRLRPNARALVLEPRGGFEVLVALSQGAQTVDVVEPNPLVVAAVRDQGEAAGNLYDDPRVSVATEEARAFVRRTRERYDVVALALTSAYHPVASGAYSLAEDYRLTREALTDYLGRLQPGGLLVILRWLQVPPSEELRAFGLAAEALERTGNRPADSLVALRSYQHMLILARRGPFSAGELAAVRIFAAERAFDLVYLPDLASEEINQYNILPDATLERACRQLLDRQARAEFLADYPFDIRPPRDDWPFFGHFFRWHQLPQALAQAGHVWQPFGGAGYLVLLGLLLLALLAAVAVMLAPLAAAHTGSARAQRAEGVALLYVGLLGLGYLCLELPLLQRFILFLGHPAYSLAVVLFALLLFSGLGSLCSGRMGLRWVLTLLPALALGYALGLPLLFRVALGASLGVRVVLAVAALAPLAWLMGMPFPKGLALLEQGSPGLVAWAWGVNGAASVVAPILAALLALEVGFWAVLALGAACYALALLTAAFPWARGGHLRR
jgi:hypothetical protein